MTKSTNIQKKKKKKKKKKRTKRRKVLTRIIPSQFLLTNCSGIIACVLYHITSFVLNLSVAISLEGIMCVHNCKSSLSSSYQTPPPFEFSSPNETDYPSCDYLESDDLDYLSPHVSDLRIMHLNIRGLISKQAELTSTIRNGYGTAKPIDIAMLNETWLRKETVNKVSIPGYTLHSKETTWQKRRRNRYSCF